MHMWGENGTLTHCLAICNCSMFTCVTLARFFNLKNWRAENIKIFMLIHIHAFEGGDREHWWCSSWKRMTGQRLKSSHMSVDSLRWHSLAACRWWCHTVMLISSRSSFCPFHPYMILRSQSCYWTLWGHVHSAVCTGLITLLPPICFQATA